MGRGAEQDQGLSESDGQTIVDALRSDHRAITEQLAAAIGEPDPDEAAAAREQLVMTVVRHFVAEEQYFYPTLRDAVEDGKDAAGAGLETDRHYERDLKQLEHHDLDDARVAEVLAGLRTAMAEHVRRQEPQLDAIAATCPLDQLVELGEGVRGAEQLAPTRPRAYAPESVPANKVLSFVEGFVSQARDYYTRRGVDPADDDA